MSLKMTRAERESFLSGLHVAVISIERSGQAPISVPIWYDYDPERGVWVITSKTSEKGRALAAAGRYTLCAQVETAPLYRYVSVEGPIVETRPADREKDVRPLARRYFGPEIGDQYVAGLTGGGDLLFRMQPERWRTVDYSKLPAG